MKKNTRVLYLVNELFSVISWGTCKNKQDSFCKVYINQAWENGKHTSEVGHNAMVWHFGAVTSCLWKHLTEEAPPECKQEGQGGKITRLGGELAAAHTQDGTF